MTPAARSEVEIDLHLRTGPPKPLTLTTRSSSQHKMPSVSETGEGDDLIALADCFGLLFRGLRVPSQVECPQSLERLVPVGPTGTHLDHVIVISWQFAIGAETSTIDAEFVVEMFLVERSQRPVK